MMTSALELEYINRLELYPIKPSVKQQKDSSKIEVYEFKGMDEFRSQLNDSPGKQISDR